MTETWDVAKAREWLLTAGLDPEFRIPVGLALGETRLRSLAALLREVDAMGKHETEAALKLRDEERAQTLAEVRRVVDEEREAVRGTYWVSKSGTHLGDASAVCDEILARLEKRARKAKRPLGAKRRAAKAAGWVDYDSWQEVLRFYRYSCALCSVDHWDQQDHIVPISRGGLHTISNVMPLCARCNGRKGTRTIWPKRRHPFMEPAE